MILKELLKDLKTQDIPEHGRKYIVAVVNYIDKHMSVSTNETATIETQINKMIDLVEEIKLKKTGVSVIDELPNFGGIMPYINNYISILSENGGLYKYVSDREFVNSHEENHKEEFTDSLSNKNKKQIKQELLKDLKTQDIPEHGRKYIVAVVNYIDKHMSVSTNETATIETQINKMIDLVEEIKLKKTGVSVIDELPNFGGIMPYINNYISILSENGGLYKYVSDREFVKDSTKRETIKPSDALKNALNKTTISQIKEVEVAERTNEQGEQSHDER